ncbi:OmpH family outer membrane protein [Candidatus Pelagibacter sp.]|nr:OmpH family outer membrane protein [Candidatus Pelagibacter sp.]MDC0641976.1 OmpH family outer membrane protein [Candidatus Pelagibacter sp.]
MLKYFFLFVFFSLINTTTSRSTETIAFVDISFIINNSISGKTVLKKIDDLKNKSIEALKKKEKILNEKNIQLNGQKKILSKEDFNLKLSNLNKEISEYNLDRKKIINEFELSKKKALDELLVKITPIIEEHMSKNSISIILNKNDIFIGNSKYNISQTILELVNKKFN